jgi:hypothetical protein
LPSGTPDTVRCTRPAPNEQATLGNSMGSLRYNSPDCLVCTGQSDEPVEQRLPTRQRSTAKVYSSKQCHAEVRAQKSEITGLSGVAPDCPVWHRTVRCNKRTTSPTVKKLQTPTAALTWRAPDSEQRLSGVSIVSRLCQRLGSG